MFDFLLRKNVIKLLILLLSVILICSFTFNFLILSNDLYYNSFIDQMSVNQIENLLIFQKKYQYLGYFLLIILNLIKILILGLLLYSSFIFLNVKVHFNDILKVVIISDSIFIFSLIIKIIWFCFFRINYNIEDVQLFYPLSLLNLFEISTINKIWIYPFQLLNIFEIIYWVLLGYGISKLINNNFDKAFKIVLSSYIPALVIWIVFVMFLTVTLNPV
jgi:hypothetical protein